MFEIRTEITIAATAARVWSVLVDFPAHPQWNPFIRKIEGVARAGERLTISIHPPGGSGKGMTFRPKVLVAESGRELRWLGRLLLPGIFDGEHYFQIEELAPAGSVRFVHGERFSGLLVPLLKSSLAGGTKAGFVAMNEALKARVER